MQPPQLPAPDTVRMAIDLARPVVVEAGGVPEWVNWVASGTAVVSALIAAWAASISARASRETTRFNRLQQEAAAARVQDEEEWRTTSSKHRFYEAMVVEPSLDAVRTYGRQIRDALEAGEQCVRAMQGKNEGALSVKKAVSDLLNKEFAPLHVAMTNAVTEAVESWEDGEFRETLRQAIEQVQEEVAKEAEKLLDPDGAPNFQAVLNHALGEAQRVVMRHAPALKAPVSVGENGAPVPETTASSEPVALWRVKLGNKLAGR